MRWFIKRPHAIDQFRKRAAFPDDMDSVVLEGELRKHLDDAAQDPSRFLKGLRDNQFAVRVAVQGRNVVYAIVQTFSGDDYDYSVPTVLTQAMYQSWSKDGKLSDIGELPPEKRELPVIKQTLFLYYVNGKGPVLNEYTKDDIPRQIGILLEQGIPMKSIKVLKEVPTRLDVQLLDVTR